MAQLAPLLKPKVVSPFGWKSPPSSSLPVPEFPGAGDELQCHLNSLSAVASRYSLSLLFLKQKLFVTSPMDSQLCAAATSADGLGQQLVLRPANWQISPKLEQSIYWGIDRIFVDLDWSQNRFSQNPEVIQVQHTPMPSKEMAIEYLRHILDNAICIRRLDLNIKVSTNTVVNDILDVLSNHGKVQLEELFVRRRYVGSKFSGLAQLIRSNAKTLKQIGKIGLGEAIKSLSEEVRLERLSLINFDLVEQDERLDSEELALNSRFYIRRLAGLGDQNACSQYAPPVQGQKSPSDDAKWSGHQGPGTSPPVVADDATNSAALEEFEVEKQDLITGRQLEKRARVLSNYAPDFSGDGYNSVAAAC
uniref:Uncharacterized protein n=1 Tax=Globodera rostochiensis TaxID=31243 RepID=A0A914IC49_GLORO